MLGVTINNKHTWRDWNMVLNEYPTVSPPAPKEKLVDLPGADGSLDFTEVHAGRVLYETRRITLKLTIMADRALWPSIYSDVLTAIHGQEVQITMDDDTEYYWSGRAKVTKYDPDKVTATMTITAEVKPHKTHRETGKKVL